MRIRSPIAGDSGEKKDKQHRRTYKDMTPEEEAKLRREKRLDKQYADKKAKEDWLKENKPEEYAKLILRQNHYIEPVDKDPLKEMLKTLELFKRAGLLAGAGGRGGNGTLDQIGDLIRDITTGDNFPDVIQAFKGGNGQGQVIEHRSAVPPPQPQPAQPPPAQNQQNGAPQLDPQILAQARAEIAQIIQAIEPPGKPRTAAKDAAQFMRQMTNVPEIVNPAVRRIKLMVSDLEKIDATPEGIVSYLKAQIQGSPYHQELWQWFAADEGRLQWLVELAQHIQGKATQTPVAPAEGI